MERDRWNPQHLDDTAGGIFGRRRWIFDCWVGHGFHPMSDLGRDGG